MDKSKIQHLFEIEIPTALTTGQKTIAFEYKGKKADVESLSTQIASVLEDVYEFVKKGKKITVDSTVNFLFDLYKKLDGIKEFTVIAPDQRVVIIKNVLSIVIDNINFTVKFGPIRIPSKMVRPVVKHYTMLVVDRIVKEL